MASEMTKITERLNPKNWNLFLWIYALFLFDLFLVGIVNLVVFMLK